MRGVMWWRAVTSWHTLSALLLTAALIGCNWFAFLIAMENGQVLQSSLGYFITPLVSILLGFVFLGERLRAVQWVAVALAAAGVANQILAVGELPWIALILAGSFGLYGLLRKTVAVPALPGLFVEAAVIVPFALVYMTWVISRTTSTLVLADGGTQGLVPVAGLITVIPLVWFSYGARRLPLATVGLLQFLAPTGHFLLATQLYGEPFTACGCHDVCPDLVGPGALPRRPPPAPAGPGRYLALPVTWYRSVIAAFSHA